MTNLDLYRYTIRHEAYHAAIALSYGAHISYLIIEQAGQGGAIKFAGIENPIQDAMICLAGLIYEKSQQGTYLAPQSRQDALDAYERISEDDSKDWLHPRKRPKEEKTALFIDLINKTISRLQHLAPLIDEISEYFERRILTYEGKKKTRFISIPSSWSKKAIFKAEMLIQK